MNERAQLLASIAETIKTYRVGELDTPTPEHVDRWASQFTPANQLSFLREFDHVMKECFITEQNVYEFLAGLVTFTKLAGSDPASYWKSAHFMKIQHHGQSQKEMLRIFAKCLKDKYGLELDQCGEPGGDFIYLDDVMFSGNRVGNDLEKWIADSAPESANVHVIVAAFHWSGVYFTNKKLKNSIKESKKKIIIDYKTANEIENRKNHRDRSAVLWPCSLPDVPEVKAFMDLPCKFPFEPRKESGAAIEPFASEQGRLILESEFLLSGAKIRARCDNPKPSMRLLGFSPFGLGFGSMITSYRNCPNNCPLAMWWGDPTATSGALNWYPLMRRKTYDTLVLEDEFDVLD